MVFSSGKEKKYLVYALMVTSVILAYLPTPIGTKILQLVLFLYYYKYLK